MTIHLSRMFGFFSLLVMLEIFTISNISKASTQTLAVSVSKSWMLDKIFHFSENRKRNTR